MHTPETVELFIQKRAAGTALQRIAEEIGVSKTTLVAWGEKYALEIAAAKQDARLEHQTRLLKKLDYRESQLDDAYDRVSPIIDDFDPDELTIMQAFRIYFVIQRESMKLQTLRFKIEDAATKLLLPPPLPKRSNFDQVLERSESPAGCNLSEHVESLQSGRSSKPHLRNDQPAVVEPFQREQPRSFTQPEVVNKQTITAPTTENAETSVKKSGGLVRSFRKRSNYGQITRKPDYISGNFLSLIANPPQPQVLPSKPDGPAYACP